LLERNGEAYRVEVLVREKKGAAWSLAIGAVVGLLLAGRAQLQIRNTRQYLQQLVMACKHEPPIKAHVSHGVGKPDTIEELYNVWDAGELLKNESTLQGRSAEIVKAYYAAAQAQNNRWLSPCVGFAIFLLPVIWYFLLERLQEIGAAISGRDRTP
jgi:hypothetical protein